VVRPQTTSPEKPVLHNSKSSFKSDNLSVNNRYLNQKCLSPIVGTLQRVPDDGFFFCVLRIENRKMLLFEVVHFENCCIMRVCDYRIFTVPYKKKNIQKTSFGRLFHVFLTLTSFFVLQFPKKWYRKFRSWLLSAAPLAGFLKSSFWWFFTLKYYFFVIWKLKTQKLFLVVFYFKLLFFCNMKTKNKLIQVFFNHSCFNNIII
jgi:hypothetical protein